MMALKDLSKKLLNNNFFTFLLFFATMLLLYAGTQEGRLSSDFYNWIYKYEKQPFSNLWTCFGYPGLHQLYHIPFYISYKLFGLNVWGWHFLFIAIHCLNGLLLYFFSKRLIKLFELNPLWGLVPALLFLVSPYQTEVVSWGACIHYLVMTSFLLASLIHLFDFLKTKKNKAGVFFHFFFLLALFCMEQSYLFPIIYLGFALLLKSYFQLKWRFILLKVVSPQILLFLAYFLIAKLSFGGFIGHYGAEEHLRFNLDQISDNLYKYLGKFVFFFRYNFKVIAVFFKDFALNDAIQIISGSLYLIALMYFFLVKPFKGKRQIHFVLFFLGAFACVLAPVLNLVMESDWSIQTDRYSYVASPFFFLALFFVLANTKKEVAITVTALWFGFSLYGLKEANDAWRESGQLKKEILKNFPLEESRPVYLLNAPDNHKGVHLFRNGIASAVDLYYNKDVKNENYKEIAYLNTVSFEDSVSITKVEDHYSIEVMHWGRWFHKLRNENENYLIENNDGIRFDLYLNAPNDSIRFMYLKGGEWKDFNRVEEEQ